MEATSGRSKIQHKGFLALLVIAAAGILFLSTSGTSSAETGKIIWQSREQFVAIEKQEIGAGKGIPGDHPPSISAARLRNILREPQIVETGKNRALPIFNEPEREILVQYILEALSQSNTSEDVTFAVIGQFPVLMGLASERKVTAGRVFFEGGQLNIIFGMIHRDVKDHEDRRLSPFVPGSRSRPATLAGKIVPSGQQAFALKRADWLVFSPIDKDSAADMPAGSGPLPAKAEEFRPAPPETGTAGKEGQKIAKPDKRGRTVEERLILLNELRQKQLITDEEYRTKRQAILDEL